MHNEIKPKALSRDESVGKAYEEDPLVARNITTAMGKYFFFFFFFYPFLSCISLACIFSHVSFPLLSTSLVVVHISSGSIVLDMGDWIIKDADKITVPVSFSFLFFLLRLFRFLFIFVYLFLKLNIFCLSMVPVTQSRAITPHSKFTI